MNDRTAKLLLDAYHGCGDATSFVADVTLEHYHANLLVRSGVERQILLVAEAVGKACKLDDSLASRLPEYQRLRGMRNRIVHDYERTDDHALDVDPTPHAPATSPR